MGSCAFTVPAELQRDALSASQLNRVLRRQGYSQLVYKCGICFPYYSLLFLGTPSQPRFSTTKLRNSSYCATMDTASNTLDAKRGNNYKEPMESGE